MIVRVDDTFQKCFVLEGAVCAFGVFDGLHLGHQYIIEQAQKHARAINAPLAIITFARDPDKQTVGRAKGFYIKFTAGIFYT